MRRKPVLIHHGDNAARGGGGRRRRTISVGTWGGLGCLLIVMMAAGGRAHAAEVIPPAPTRYVADEGHVLSPGAAEEINSKLEGFERSTSSQVVVAIYPHMQSDS